MKDRLSNLKNLLWAAAILLCLLAMLVGLIFSMSQKSQGERADGTITLGQIERVKKAKASDVAGLEGAVKTLIPVPETPKGNLESVFGMTFLCDKTIMGIKTYASNYGDGIIPSIWTDDGSGLGVACADEHFGPLTAVGGVIGLSDGRLTQSIDFRYPTTTTSAEIERSVRERATDAGATFAMEHDKTPFLMDPESPAVRALLDAYNDATGENRGGVTSKGGTYARAFTTGVSFGVEKPWEEDPAWVGGMHGPDEGVSEDLLKQALAIYIRTIGNLMELDL